jgi:hypothetical protein
MATDKSAAPTTYRRASEFDTFGSGLDSILGRDVILRRFSISERPITDRATKERGDKVFVNIWINELDAPDVEPKVYHAWSEPLANKLGQIPDDEMAKGLLIKFIKVDGAQGKVLTFE